MPYIWPLIILPFITYTVSLPNQEPININLLNQIEILKKPNVSLNEDISEDVSSVDESIRKLYSVKSTTPYGSTEEYTEEDPTVIEKEVERQQRLITKQTLRFGYAQNFLIYLLMMILVATITVMMCFFICLLPRCC